MDQTLIRQIVEAALLAAPQPLTLAQLAGLFPEDEPAPAGGIEQDVAGDGHGLQFSRPQFAQRQ